MEAFFKLKTKRFISIRWKLVFTYIVLILCFVIILNLFITSTLFNIYANRKKVEILSSANILSNTVKYFINQTEGQEELLGYPVINYSEQIGAHVLVLDAKGKVLKDSNKSLDKQYLKHSEIKSALKGKSAVSIYDFDEVGTVMYVAVPINAGNDIIGVTFISYSLNETNKIIKEVQQVMNIISFLGIIFIGFVGVVFADYFSKPIQGFTLAIKKMAQGDLSQRVEVSTNDEFRMLADSFNLMSSQIDQVDTQRKDFVANVSHELRTPLSSIKLLSNSLLMDESASKEIYKEFLTDIDSEVDRLNNIITDLLLLVDLDKSKLSINPKITYLNFLLGKIINRLKPLAEDKKIQITFIERDKVQLKVDPEKIQQAIINIIHNAIKYTPDEGRVNIELYQENNKAVIKVEDNGDGMEENQLTAIFERFYRVDRARSRKTGGTGLGLSIALQIVQLHQGEIKVESALGQGSCFYIILPIRE